jgi:hypothetical protein
MDLLHQLSVDPISHSKEPVAVDPVKGSRHDLGDAPDEVSIVPIEGMTRAHERYGAPCPATPSYRSNQHVALNWRLCVADVACQNVEIPVAALWEREEQVGHRMAWAERGNATVGGLKEVVRLAESIAECFVRLAGVFQVSGQVIDEFERGEFPLDLQHAA